MLERDWLLAAARAEREALGRTIQYTPPETWARPSPLEGWRVGEIVAHLAAAEVAAAGALVGESPGEVEEYAKGLPRGDEPTLEGFSRWSADRRAEIPVRQLALEWGRAGDLLLVRASKLSDEEWGGRTVAWFGTELPAGDFIQMRVAEWWVHGGDLLAGAGLPARIEHPPIHCANDLAIRLIPYGLSLAGLSYPGAAVRVELEGAGEGRWLQAVHPDGVAGEGPPDAAITGWAPAFAEVASRRADVDVVLYDGVIQLGGDLDLAEAVLRNLRLEP